MKFWRLTDSNGDPLYLDPELIAAVYLSAQDAAENIEAGQVRILLNAGTSCYFSLDDKSGLQVLEHFQRVSSVPGE